MKSLHDLLDELAALLEEQPSLRPSVDWYRRVGAIFLEIKGRTRHGEFTRILKRIAKDFRIGQRTAEIYMQVAKSQHAANLTGEVSLRQLLAALKAGRRQLKAEDTRRRHQEADARSPALDKSFALHHADCRTFAWPKVVDAIFTDPPWSDLEAYRWLADFAAERLRPGGLCIVQCGQSGVAEVMRIMGDKLDYVYLWTIYFPQVVPSSGPFSCSSRPLLVFSRGKWDRQGLSRTCDTMSSTKAEKTLHPWEQPVKPFVRWIAATTRPNSLIADPFAGSGTTGLATRLAGDGRTWIGTERDERYVAAARLKISEGI